MEGNQLNIGDKLYQPNSWAGAYDEVKIVTDSEAITVNARRFNRLARDGEYFEIHKPSSDFWMEKHMPWQLISPPVSVQVPLSIAQKTATAEGAVHLKQILNAAFTSYYQSGMFEALASEEKDSTIQALLGINDLIDSVYIGQRIQGISHN